MAVGDSGTTTEEESLRDDKRENCYARTEEPTTHRTGNSYAPHRNSNATIAEATDLLH
jgi:hypothetical protein